MIRDADLLILAAILHQGGMSLAKIKQILQDVQDNKSIIEILDDLTS